MPKCETCGKDFVVSEFDEFPEEVDVCYECLLEYLRQDAPEAFADLDEIALKWATVILDKLRPALNVDFFPGKECQAKARIQVHIREALAEATRT
jgi:hypothetical protein